VRLLRVLQEKTFEPVGSSEAINVDVRVLAATNVDLGELVQEGTFREDLYYRLNVVPLHIPALRERREDIPLLVEHFLEVFSRENDKDVRRLSREVLDLLMAYDWPGNVRELENCIERAVVMSQSGVFTAELLPQSVRNPSGRPAAPPTPAHAEQALDELIAGLRRDRPAQLHEAVIALVEKRLIAHVLSAHDGVQTRTARELGISRNTLRARMEQYGLA
jgi:DNA-binding NtrC family response regulator